MQRPLVLAHCLAIMVAATTTAFLSVKLCQLQTHYQAVRALFAWSLLHLLSARCAQVIQCLSCQDPHLQLSTGCLYALVHDEGVRKNIMGKAGPLTAVSSFRIEDFWSQEGCMEPITEHPLRAITALSAVGGTRSWTHGAQIKASFASLSDFSMASPASSHAAGMSQSMTGRSRAAWRLDGRAL